MIVEKKTFDKLNLENIINRVMKVQLWSRKGAEQVSEYYKNFLFLKYKYRHAYDLPPSVEIDEFWHMHIIHTKQYHQDCEKLFGEYLHHDPAGENGSKTQDEFNDMFVNQTQRLYFQEFDEYIYEINV